MNKKNITFALLGVFALALVSAAYVVSSFSIQVDIEEPFTVMYAIPGDAGVPAWQFATTCNEINDSFYVDFQGESQPIDFDYLFAGENRKFCAMIANDAENAIGYVVSAEVRSGQGGNYQDCVDAFGDISDLTGDVDAFDTIKVGKVISIPADAKPIDDCIIDISVGRKAPSA